MKSCVYFSVFSAISSFLPVHCRKIKWLTLPSTFPPTASSKTSLNANRKQVLFIQPFFYFEYIPFIDIYSISSRIALNKDKIFQMLLKFKLHLKRLTWDIVKVQKFQIFLNQTQYLHLHNAITLEAISRHSKTQESHQYVCVLVSFMAKTIKVKFQ